MVGCRQCPLAEQILADAGGHRQTDMNRTEHLRPHEEEDGSSWFLRAQRPKTKLVGQGIICAGVPTSLIQGTRDGR